MRRASNEPLPSRLGSSSSRLAARTITPAFERDREPDAAPSPCLADALTREVVESKDAEPVGELAVTAGLLLRGHSPP